MKRPKLKVNKQQELNFYYALILHNKKNNQILNNKSKKNMATIKIEVTKVKKILMERDLTQTDFYHLIKENGKEIGKDRINKIVKGTITNYHVDTAKTLAKALNVTLDEIVE